MQSCFLIGNRDTDEAVFDALCAAMEHHVRQYGVTEFVMGRYGNFDRLAARAVRQIKQTYPAVKATLLLPYHPVAHSLSLSDVFDGAVYPFEDGRVPYRAAIVRANRRMVDRSTYLIAHVGNSVGNSRELVEYARRREEQGLLHITLV